MSKVKDDKINSIPFKNRLVKSGHNMNDIASECKQKSFIFSKTDIIGYFHTNKVFKDAILSGKYFFKESEYQTV